jgi:hypothetical protein
LGEQQKQPGLDAADGVGAVQQQQQQQQHAGQQLDQLPQQQQQQPEQHLSQNGLSQQQHVEQQQQPHSSASSSSASSSSDPQAAKQARLQLLQRMLAFMVSFRGAVQVNQHYIVAVGSCWGIRIPRLGVPVGARPGVLG